MIPLTTQDDLDKAVELLDRSVHMKSLKILLVLQNLSQVSRLTGNTGSGCVSPAEMLFSLFLQNSSSNMDLLPSHEELDNTGFRVADKKSMLALIGEQCVQSHRSIRSTETENKSLPRLHQTPQAPIRRTAALLLRDIFQTRSNRWPETAPSPASTARGSSFLRAWTR